MTTGEPDELEKTNRGSRCSLPWEGVSVQETRSRLSPLEKGERGSGITGEVPGVAYQGPLGVGGDILHADGEQAGAVWVLENRACGRC